MRVMPPATAAGVRPRRGSPGLRAGAALGILLGGLLGPGREVAARHHHARAHEPAAKPGAKPGAKEEIGIAKSRRGRGAPRSRKIARPSRHCSSRAGRRWRAWTTPRRSRRSPRLIGRHRVRKRCSSSARWPRAEHRGVAARDLLRRYLQEAAGEAESPEQKEAQRIVELDPGASGEINILGTPRRAGPGR